MSKLTQNRRNIWSTVAFLLCALPAIAGAPAETWEVGMVEGTMGGNFSSLKIDSYGNVHVASAGDLEGSLQYSFWDHRLRKWFTTNLGRTSGFCSLALDSQDRPHVSWVEFGSSVLHHAYWNGSSWQHQSIRTIAKSISFYTSIALDRHDYPNISFYEYVGAEEDQFRRLRLLRWNGQVWELQTIDADPGSGKFNSIAIDSAGNVQAAYCNVDPERASLRYARLGGALSHDIIESGYSKSWQAAMLLVDKHDVPHIAYSDVLNRIVKYATKVDGAWHVEAVDSLGGVAYPDRNGIALDEEGTPYISYYDTRRGQLKLAHRSGPIWLTEVVDGDDAGFTSSLEIRDQTIWLTYAAGPAGGLKYATRKLKSAPKPVPSGAAVAK